MKNIFIFILITLGFLAMIAIRLTVFLGTPPRPDEAQVENRPIEVREKGFVSSKTCASCHPHEHATWHSSYHRTMTQVATPEAVIGDFDGKLRNCGGKGYRLGRDGDDFWVEITEPGKEPARKDIVMTTGSHHMQAYWFATGDPDKGRMVGLVPWVYLNLENEKKRWVEEYATFLHDPQFTPHYQAEGKWNKFCRQCHATGVQPRLGKDRMDTRVAELGISCESCHGPGEEHVRIYSDPSLRYQRHLDSEGRDPTIVNPARLPPKESSQVCGQCHSIWMSTQEEGKKELEGGFTYRAGQDLSSTRQVIHGADMDTQEKKVDLIKAVGRNFLDDRYWSDGMIRIAGREYSGLVDSPCYKHDNPEKTMRCMSCHILHKRRGSAESIKEWRDDQLGEGMRGNKACLQCHEDMSAKVPEHTHHQAGSSGSLCYNCHMPHTTYGLLKGIRSHTISAPSVQESLQTGRPNACNACHLDKTLEWTAGHLESWYGIGPPTLTPPQQKIAASILWILGGDAGQRALTAWAMGWKPAQEISGTGWMAPYLAPLMQQDPYPAVRYIAQHSLRTIPGFRFIEYDYMAHPNQREAILGKIHDIWKRSKLPAASRKGSLLIDPSGNLAQNVWQALLKTRNNQRVNLEE